MVPVSLVCRPEEEGLLRRRSRFEDNMNNLIVNKTVINPHVVILARCLSSGRDTGCRFARDDINNIAALMSRTSLFTPKTKALKKGSVPRSSFPGTAVFGSPGFLASSLVNRTNSGYKIPSLYFFSLRSFQTSSVFCESSFVKRNCVAIFFF